jgi:hypothetical protein
MRPFSRSDAIAFHGPLAVRLADRMIQFRCDRAKAMLDRSFNDEGPDELNRFAEAKALIAIVRAHDGLSGVDAHGDAGESERLYGLSVGHVLTDQDVKDIECLMADHNDQIGHEAEKWDQARKATLFEIGGDDLVTAVEARDETIMSAAVERAMAKFRSANTARPTSTDS